jgi:tRNA 2-thiouridine synthesizing protein E
MPDINDYISHPESSSTSPEMLDRELTLNDWNKNIAEKQSEKEGIVLTQEHWQVISYLQDYYLHNGWPQNAHTLTKKLDAAFTSQGGGRYLYTLFPGGPLSQGCRIAGLPVPQNAENESMGTAQ